MTTATLTRAAVEVPTALAFAQGLPGFAGADRFTLQPVDAAGTLFRLTAPDGPSFLAVVPGACFPDYAPVIPTPVVESLGVTGAEDVALLVLLSIPSGDPAEATANLLAPIVLNRRTGAAAQAVLADATRYPLRRPLHG